MRAYSTTLDQRTTGLFSTPGYSTAIPRSGVLYHSTASGEAACAAQVPVQAGI